MEELNLTVWLNIQCEESVWGPTARQLEHLHIQMQKSYNHLVPCLIGVIFSLNSFEYVMLYNKIYSLTIILQNKFLSKLFRAKNISK